MLAKLCAIAAGVLLTVVTLMTCVSLLGRNLVGSTIVGDFELSGAAAVRDRAVHAVVPAAARQHHRRLLHAKAASARSPASTASAPCCSA
jgi:hypothetical protein